MAYEGHGYNTNTSAPTVGSSWTDVCEITSMVVSAGRALTIQASWLATVLVAAGDVRLTINGNEVKLGTDALAVGSYCGMLQHEEAITVGSTYTIKLQAKKNGLGSVTIATGGAQLTVWRTTT